MKETKAYWGKNNCFVDVRLPDSETEVIRFWNDQLNESYEPKTLTDGIDLLEKYADKLENERPNKGFSNVVYECIEILRKASEK